MYYYNARYYDPHLGSFITPDPAMDGINHYAYCNANPITYSDPTGLYGDYSNPGSQPTQYDDGSDSYVPYTPSDNTSSSSSSSDDYWAKQKQKIDEYHNWLWSQPYKQQEFLQNVSNGLWGEVANQIATMPPSMTNPIIGDNLIASAPGSDALKNYGIGKEKYPNIAEAQKIYDEWKDKLKSNGKGKDIDKTGIIEKIIGAAGDLPTPFLSRVLSAVFSVATNLVTTTPNLGGCRQCIYNKMYSQYVEKTVEAFNFYQALRENPRYKNDIYDFYNNKDNYRDMIDTNFNYYFGVIKDVCYPNPPDRMADEWRDR